MRKWTAMVCFVLIFSSGCSNKEHHPKQPVTGSASWAYGFVVWKGTEYVDTNERVKKAARRLGSIDQSSDEETASFNLNQTFTNFLPAGTKIYSLPGKSENEFIAAQINDEDYEVLQRKG
ncbi:hypothetical protein [Paenibacillus humicola]|uniref:hypothetical protein n=1 Tax=Paenibacillus humicola TaxID=3110540 RepID=UPI00237B08F0|nr:hypothetical protein [Paenibacillus humicola]